MKAQRERQLEFLYIEAATKLRKMIESGVYQSGERLPSVRKLSKKLGVSISTVFQAYQILEGQGLVEARPQSGFYARARAAPGLNPPEMMEALPPISADNKDLVRLLVRTGRLSQMVAFDSATLDPELAPYLQLGRSLSRAVRARPAESIAYDTPPGNIRLRKIIASRSLDWGGSAVADEIVITHGATEGLGLCLRAVAGPGDSVVIESPSYYGLIQLMETQGLKAIEVPTDPNIGMSPEHLRKALRKGKIKACFINSNFSNPTGSLIPDDRKAEILKILNEESVPLIEDDVYGDLQFGANRPRTFKSFDRHGSVLLVSSFSKTLSPGYRIGWVMGGRYHDRICELQWFNTIAANTPGQLALVEFVQSGAYDRHLRRLRPILFENLQRTRATISRSFPSGTRITEPKGGFLLWLEMPKEVNALQIYHKALKLGIRVMPGNLFAPQARYNHHLRISLGAPWSRRHEAALAELGNLVTQSQ